MTPKERWLAVLSHEKPDRVPMDLWATDEARVNVMRHLRVGNLTELCERLHIDMPLTLEPAGTGPRPAEGFDMFGCGFRTVSYATGSYSECVVHPLAPYETVEEIDRAYAWPSADWFDYSVVPGQLAGNEHRPVQIHLENVYALYTRLRGMEQAFVDFALDHEMVTYIMGRSLDLYYEIAERTLEQVPGKVDIGRLSHDMGSQENLLCSPETIRALFLPGIRRFATLAHQSGMKLFMHSDGAIGKIIPDLIEAGVDILNPIQWRCAGMDRAGLKRDFGSRLVFHGAVDNQQTLAGGSVQDVEAEVRYNIDVLGAGGGYILAPCHNIQPVSPAENIVAMYETGYACGRY